MFFPESAQIAEQHPDLARAIELLDSQLGRLGPGDVIRPDDLASFLRIDPNQIRSALEMFAEDGVLNQAEMVECSFCQMAAPRSDYQEALDDEDEYRCTSCDRPLADRTMRVIAAYQRGEKWPEVQVSNLASAPHSSSSSSSSPVLDEMGWYSHDRLAEAFDVGKDALRKRLDRFRKHKLDGWKERDDRRPREAKYLYQLRAVTAIIDELCASSQRPAK
jgi:transcription initiation factor IIE alpha subunit